MYRIAVAVFLLGCSSTGIEGDPFTDSETDGDIIEEIDGGCMDCTPMERCIDGICTECFCPPGRFLMTHALETPCIYADEFRLSCWAGHLVVEMAGITLRPSERTHPILIVEADEECTHYEIDAVFDGCNELNGAITATAEAGCACDSGAVELQAVRMPR